MIVLAFLSGIAFVFFLLFIWSLVRTSAQADALAERLMEKERDMR